MSDIKVNNITSRDGNHGPIVAGVSTVASSAFMTMPAGNTEVRGSGSGRAIFCGGSTPTILNTIDTIEIATTGNAVDFGDLPRGTVDTGSFASATRGFTAGGYDPSYLSAIDYVVFSSAGGGNEFDDLDMEPVNTVAMTEPEPVAEPEPTPMFSAFAELEQDTEEEEKMGAEIDRLKTQLSSLARQASDSRNRLNKIEAQVEKIAKSSVDNSAKLSKLIKTQEDQIAEKKKEVVLQDYKIRALISSRAWLEDKFGNNITIKVGDNIPTYGRVTKIKPVEGIVETSSGRIITFALND